MAFKLPLVTALIAVIHLSDLAVMPGGEGLLFFFRDLSDFKKPARPSASEPMALKPSGAVSMSLGFETCDQIVRAPPNYSMFFSGNQTKSTFEQCSHETKMMRA